MIQPRPLLSIQYLRGLAALGVVAYHTHWTHSELGAAGVDVFFVISGFIMALVSRREPTPAAFLRARALRIVPLYWLVTLVAAAVYRVPDAGHLLQSLAFWPHRGPGGTGWPVLLQGWTLCYEAFFYVLFAASLLVPRRSLLALTAALLGLAAAGAILHPTSSSAVETFTSPMLLEFLAGIWLHQAWQQGWMLPAGPTLAIGMAALAAQAALPAPGIWRWLVWGVPAALVVAGALGLESAGRVPRLRYLRQLGDASYATYLTHTLVQDAVLPLLRPLPALLAVPAAMGGCIAVGWVAYRCVERPVTRWAFGKLMPRHAGLQHGTA